MLRRLGYSLLVLWGVVSLVFVLFNVLPADPARLTLGQRSDLSSLENVRRELNLDKPLGERYLLYLNDLAPLSVYKHSPENALKYNYHVLFHSGTKEVVLKRPYLGRSYRTKRNVAEVLGEALPGTLVLAVTAMLIAMLLGIALGMLSAYYKGTWIDTSAVAASVAGISLPSFFAGLLVAYVFAYVLQRYTGLEMTGSLWEYNPLTGQKVLALRHLVLPAFALGVRPLAIITQLTRSSLLDTIHKDFIRTGYAKGLSRFQVYMRHALPNALNPVVTAISGWTAELLAGSFFVEYIFGWKGLGKLTVDALDRFDFPLVMGSVLLSATIFVVVNLLTDLIYTRLDPRVRI
ncbi:ABC transporter permease [Rurimicrobium arvi]|uniref:ABC transporter permease n=1 Tax=Rurimicrobium arvi TaxID=2049916 RepID=A0ABP8N179_9BACT